MHKRKYETPARQRNHDLSGLNHGGRHFKSAHNHKRKKARPRPLSDSPLDNVRRKRQRVTPVDDGQGSDDDQHPGLDLLFRDQIMAEDSRVSPSGRRVTCADFRMMVMVLELLAATKLVRGNVDKVATISPVEVNLYVPAPGIWE